MSISGDWRDNNSLRDTLIGDGWVTPDTYGNCYAKPEKQPAVYLLMLVDRKCYKRCLVAYVGMSTRLCHRLVGHEVIREIDRPEFFTMRWFKPVPKPDLRAVEARYISEFEPPWNIIGRRRGVPLGVSH